MPRIAPVPIDQLDPDVRARLQHGVDIGHYDDGSHVIPPSMRTLCWSRYAIDTALAQGDAMWREGLLGRRLKELVRIRSAQINGCANCAGAIKDDSVDGDTVACMNDMDLSAFTPREAAALRYVTKFGADHHAIGDEDIRALQVQFSPAEVVELIHYCAVMLGSHRMFSVFQVLSDRDPVIPFDPAAVNQPRHEAHAAAQADQG
jgi:alkylhydroperoxidase family enzyme